ncbi:S-adenosylmethionine sensor upstream of mTORC1 [Homalodisca vitripennis]|uniref:S-adenosylmethionine sensor upstream of mTORC1 n=1 Tax=Homalodisca vitripennis TaxID=197043 RepID=UPI001EEB21F3|nr:S-adenosylmethionine sensor upstream of mTORC1 [Homalodisca vitripennis]XP_046665245.1 S-adenosylmethionine sensor upstream of mTORC1 [Homalodisca vitripennis]
MASEKHKELAAFIKGVHQNLRLQSRSVGAEQAWSEHCQQTHVLEKYAENMKLLATEFWEKNNSKESDLCRIKWVVNQCEEYFYKSGYVSAAAKENKLSTRFLNKPVKQVESSGDVLKLIDVGSCYNPFSNFSIFEVTALDLMPATSDVIKCDFLSVNIDIGTKVIENPCFDLPAEHFDVVVFSLLLEYFPFSDQRFRCCANAYKLLKPGGLLFILTPDSKHATANSKVMKSWRYALASLGFWRVSYQKLRHLHCMAYRKCVDPQVSRSWFVAQQCQELPETLMCIPQDFHDYCDTSADVALLPERCDVDNSLLADTFSSLPDVDVFS